MTSGDGRRRETILKISTRLFAALGYDGMSVTQIAEATGLSIETIGEEFGSKRELFLAVMDHTYRAERASLEAALKGWSSRSTSEETAATLHRIVDHYIDLCLEHPEVPALRLHRWLSDASDLTELEHEYLRPLVELINDVVEAALNAGHVGPDVDLEYVMWSVVWSVHGFIRGGVLDREGNLGSAEDPATLRRFRNYLHRAVHRTATLPGPPP